MISIEYSLLTNLLTPTLTFAVISSILLFLTGRTINEPGGDTEENQPPIGEPGEPGNGNGWK